MVEKQNSTKQTQRKRHPPERAAALARATKIVHQICQVAGSTTLLDDARAEGSPRPLGRSIERLDTPALFDWLIAVLSFQGVSDATASGYMRKHGSVTWIEIAYRLSKRPRCPKLQSYWNFHRCGYEKIKRTCSCPEYFKTCPVPRHNLRNGRLNQSAYALFFFLRDICDDDLVNWIDGRLMNASWTSEAQRIAAMREALLFPLRHIYGLGDKVLSMALATLLLAAQDIRDHWHEVGGSMLAIDTLVHKFLLRTGIIQQLGIPHPYGPACYAEGGCAQVIGQLAARINAREFNPAFPRVFPRFVQHALWRYCAQDEWNICNSVQIRDTHRCRNLYCRVFGICAREKIDPQ